ncbi:MAG: hypothetical protein Q8L21_03760 [Candidatus Komeilibacteria bacterium]|nr:hypothetical protein [Candidatus Komeilibacteria bacterium]
MRLAAVVATYVSGKRLEDRLVELGKCQCEFDKLWLSDEGRKQIWSVLATADQALHNYQQWRGGMPPDEQTKQAPPPAYNLSHLVAGWVKPSATSE